VKIKLLIILVREKETEHMSHIKEKTDKILDQKIKIEF